MCAHQNNKAAPAPVSSAAWDEVHEKLSTTCVDMGKAVKASTKVYSAGLNLDDPSRRQQTAITALEESLQSAEKLCDELGWMCKYKKAKNGDKVTVPGAKAVQAEAARCLRDLVDSTKSLRVLLPQKQQTT